jgi:hypothetical protein
VIICSHNPWTDWSPRADLLEQFTIYYSPSDMPGCFIVRRYEIGPAGIKPCEGMIAPTLGAARGCIPKQLVCVPRNPDDAPSVLETWT